MGVNAIATGPVGKHCQQTPSSLWPWPWQAEGGVHHFILAVLIGTWALETSLGGNSSDFPFSLTSCLWGPFCC